MMNTAEFRRQDDDVEDRTDEPPALATAPEKESASGWVSRNLTDGAKKLGEDAMGKYQELTGKNPLGDALGMKDLKGYAEGGLVTDDDETQGDSSDDTTDAISKALQTVNSVLMYGRQKNGLPAGSPVGQSDDDQSQGIPDDTQGYADGGEVSDDIENEGAQDGAIPNDAPDDNSGAAPVMAYDPNQDTTDQGQGVPTGVPALPTPAPDQQPATLGGDRPWYAQDNGMLPVNAAKAAGSAIASASGTAEPTDEYGRSQTILNYLTGGDAMSPQEFDKYMKMTRDQADTPSDNTALAIAAAADDKGGPYGFAALQAARKDYDRSADLARAAAEKGDISGAVTAGNKAYEMVPHSSVTFTQTKDGITADIADRVSGKTQQQMLSPQQFGQLMDIRSTGQYDHILERGAPAAFQFLDKTPQAPTPQAPSTVGQAKDNRLSTAQRQQQAGSTGPTISGRIPASGYYDDNMTFHQTQAAHNGSIQQDAPDDKNAKVNILGFGNAPDRTYGYGGQNLTPDKADKAQENKLALVKAQSDARELTAKGNRDSREKIAQGNRQNSMDQTKLRVGATTRGQDIRSSDRKAYLDMQKAHYDQLAERFLNVQQQENYRAMVRSGADPDVAWKKSSEQMGSTPAAQQVRPQGAPQPPQATAPQPQQAAPQQAAAPQAAPQRLKLDGVYYIKGPDGKAMVDPNQR